MVEFLPKESPDEWNTRHVERLRIHAGLIYIQKQKQKQKQKKPKEPKKPKKKGSCTTSFATRNM
jgi:hypothetical protein